VEILKEVVAVDSHWVVVEELRRERQAGEIVAVALQLPHSTAERIGHMPHNHLVKSAHIKTMMFQGLAVGCVWVGASSGCVVLRILRIIGTRCRATRSRCGRSSWGHSGTGAGSGRIVVSSIATSIRIWSIGAITVASLAAISSGMATKSTLGSVLEFFIVLSNILQEIFAQLFGLLDVIGIGAPINVRTEKYHK
jgi:hypothetical protein